MDKTPTNAGLARQVCCVLRGSGITIWEGAATAVVVAVLTPLIGSVIGVVGTTVLSAVVGVPAGRVLDSIMTHGRRTYCEIIYGEKVTSTLLIKLTEEFQSSILSHNINIAEEFAKGFDALKDARIEPTLNHDALNQSVRLQSKINDEEKKIVIDAAKKISEIGKIRIKVPAVYPAAVATFKRVSYLVNSFGGKGTTLIIDCSSLLGIDMLSMMSCEPDHDFIFIANSPFYLWDSSNIAEKYHPIFPAHRSKHVLIRKRYRDYSSGNVLRYQPGTSAQEAAFNLKLQDVKFKLSPLLRGTVHVGEIANNLESDEILVAISPYCDSLTMDEANQLEIIGEPHFNRDSLFGHADWFKPKLDKYREAFAVLFLIAWRQCKEDHKQSLDMLFQDENYLDAFARSIGALL